MTRLIHSNLPGIHDLCRRYHVLSLHLFGSAATPDFDPEASDLDFLVQFDPAHRGPGFSDVYFEIRDALTTLFAREIDLVEAPAPRNPYIRASIEDRKLPLYPTP